MKKAILYSLFALTIVACTNKAATTEIKTETSTVKTPATAAADTTFDITKIPLSDKDLGTFPYLTPPPKYSYNYAQEAKPKDIKVVDKEYFAVNGKLILQEGKTYKIYLEKDRSDGKKFDSAEALKYYQDRIAALGGVQVNDVEIPKAEYDRVGEKEIITNQYGYSLDPNLLDRIKTFVIRTKDQVVWIQLCLLNEESGRISVLARKG